MTDDEDASLGISDGDLSSADLSDGEWGAKQVEHNGGREEERGRGRGRGRGSAPELGDAPPLLSGYSQTYLVRKRDPERDEGRNRPVGGTLLYVRP